MSRYVALLGSINVGGNRLSMADLRHALEREEFENVETVVASGNVLFDHDERPVAGLAEKIAHIVADRFDLEIPVVVLTRKDLQAALDENPFTEDGEEKMVHVHFLPCQPSETQFAQVMEDQEGRGSERIAPGTKALHIDFVDGVARSRLTGLFLEKRLGGKGTARNVRSLKRIIEKFD